ncbi:MAG: hypothetical protein ACXWVB_04040 [Rhodoplanes sp.]
MPHVIREGDEIAAALGGLLAQHGPESGAQMSRSDEQQRHAVGPRRFRQKAGEFGLARRAPASTLAHEQPIQPAAVEMKVRRYGERRPHWAAASRSWPAASRSSLFSATSNVTCLCRRQDIVSVVAKSPFSKNLLPGGPPPQNGA